MDNKTFQCKVCGANIPESSNMTPLNCPDEGAKIYWAHQDCIDKDDDRIPICKHWRTKGTCMYRDKCRFRHLSENCGDMQRNRGRHGTWQRKRVFNEGRAGALRRWLIITFGVEYLRSGSGVLDVAGGKGEISFEILNLNSIQCTVIDPRPLDIYRFQRKLAFGFYHKNSMLQKYNNVPYSEYCIQEEGDTISPQNFAHFNSQPKNIHLCKTPQHIRCLFEVYLGPSRAEKELLHHNFVETNSVNKDNASVNDWSETCKTTSDDRQVILGTGGVGERGGDDGADGANTPCSPAPHVLALASMRDFDDKLAQSRRIQWTSKGLTEHEDGDVVEDDSPSDECSCCSINGSDHTGNSAIDSLKHDSALFGGREVDDYKQACDIVNNCSVVVGMHPDQAAEHIVEFGLRTNKPFALIPCCVYHKQFPHRRLSNGNPVTSYGELVEYLMAKSPHIRAVEMDFEGKNIMLYYLGERENHTAGIPLDSYHPQIVRGVAVPDMWWALSTNLKK